MCLLSCVLQTRLASVGGRPVLIFVCVIYKADVDNVEAAKAVVKGLKNKFEKTGQKGILIHTVRCVPVAPSMSHSEFVLAVAIYSSQ